MAESFKDLVLLTVMVVLISSTAAFSHAADVNSQTYQHEKGNAMVKMLRRAREVEAEGSDEGAYSVTSVEEVVDPCQEYFDCLLPTGGHWFFLDAVGIDMQRVMETLSSVCKDIREPSQCDGGICNTISYSLHSHAVSMMNYRILRWSCEHVANFTAGESCWAPAFRQRMIACIFDSERKTRDMPEIVDCYAHVPRGLDPCFEKDAQLVRAWFDYIVQVGEEEEQNIGDDFEV